MKPYRSKTAVTSGNKSVSAGILEDWLDASTNFYINYNQLIACIGQSTNIVSSDKRPLFLGQCPLDELVNVAITMQTELEILVREMKRLDKKEHQGRRLTSPQKNQKLADQTRRLNRLNQQAESRLWLAGLSPS